MKKFFLLGIFSLISAISLFAQQLERITYQEIRADGVYVRDVTVNAVLLGWSQREYSLDGNFLVINECIRLVDGEWSDWKFVERQPAQVSSLRGYYDGVTQDYSRLPRVAKKFYYQGLEVILMMNIPDGRSSPIWWNKDGKSFFIFQKIYLIKP